MKRSTKEDSERWKEEEPDQTGTSDPGEPHRDEVPGLSSNLLELRLRAEDLVTQKHHWTWAKIHK